ncbi:MAG: hypothetical protein AAFX10_14040 [Pseudomonadota bacterium]
MDKLEQTLKDDAAKIRAEVSPELDYRIRASLEGVRPEAGRPRSRRPVSMWWASSLTGAAAAIVIIVLVITLETPPGSGTDEVPVAEVNGIAATPPLLPELSTRAAVLAGPLEQELENLESDLRKARDVVRKDLGLDM